MSKLHVTKSGETFDALALIYYTDEKLASTIIRANPDHCTTLIFEDGVELTIPDAAEVSAPETLPPWRRDQ